MDTKDQKPTIGVFKVIYNDDEFDIVAAKDKNDAITNLIKDEFLSDIEDVNEIVEIPESEWASIECWDSEDEEMRTLSELMDGVTEYEYLATGQDS